MAGSVVLEQFALGTPRLPSPDALEFRGRPKSTQQLPVAMRMRMAGAGLDEHPDTKGVLYVLYGTLGYGWPSQHGFDLKNLPISCSFSVFSETQVFFLLDTKQQGRAQTARRV